MAYDGFAQACGVSLVQSNELRPGEQLPAEPELAQLVGVSSAPVRQSILDVVRKPAHAPQRPRHLRPVLRTGREDLNPAMR
jgi:Bacterial regulatory proteins, gntR family